MKAIDPALERRVWQRVCSQAPSRKVTYPPAVPEKPQPEPGKPQCGPCRKRRVR